MHDEDARLGLSLTPDLQKQFDDAERQKRAEYQELWYEWKRNNDITTSLKVEDVASHGMTSIAPPSGREKPDIRSASN
jgi:hypothetical protein